MTQHNQKLSNIKNHGLVFGLAGLSGTGKTTLAEKLITIFTSKGLNVASIKHAHHDFDPDIPGKDSWRHRQAGVTQMIISSAKRRVKFTETANDDEADLNDLLGELSASDIVLIEGYKRIDFPKIEIHRKALGHDFLFKSMPGIKVIATDHFHDDIKIEQIDLNDPQAIAERILKGFE